MSKRKRRSKNKRGKKGKDQFKNRDMPSTAAYTRLEIDESSDEDDRNAGGKQDGRTLKVYIYQSEMNKIKNWVLLHENIETGGDLFGLWIDSHTAVVQFALGPGKKCRRYETSFFQDLEYLATAGNYLTQKHGLCNLGQWHSHHQLSLNEPSGGDESTVWGNMPTLGLRRYIVCIANISRRRSSHEALVNCFLFELGEQKERQPVLKGEFQMLERWSPLTKHCEAAAEISEGAESVPLSLGNDYPSLGHNGRRFLSCLWFKLTKCSKKQNVIIAFILIFIVFAIVLWYRVKKTHRPEANAQRDLISSSSLVSKSK